MDQHIYQDVMSTSIYVTKPNNGVRGSQTKGNETDWSNYKLIKKRAHKYTKKLTKNVLTIYVIAIEMAKITDHHGVASLKCHGSVHS